MSCQSLPCTPPRGPHLPAPLITLLSLPVPLSLSAPSVYLYLSLSLSPSLSPPPPPMSLPVSLATSLPTSQLCSNPPHSLSAAIGCGVSRCPCWTAVKSLLAAGVGGSPPPPLAQTLAHAQGHRDERLHGPPAPPRARSAAAKVAWLGPCPLWTMLPHCQQSGWGRGGDPKGLSHWASERGYAGPYPSLWPSPDFMQDAGVHGGGHQGGGKEENK